MKSRLKLISWVMLMVFNFTLLMPIAPAAAAGSITLSPAAVTLGYTQPVNVTATGTNTNFDQDTLVRLYKNGTLQEGKILSTLFNNPTSMSFQIATGLAAGTYEVRISTPQETVSANFTVNAPSVSLSPNSAPEGYTAAVNVTATGAYTSFVNGNTAVKLYNGSTEVTGAISDLSIANNTSLSFKVATGRTAGTYTVKIITGTEVVEAPFTVYPVSISMSPNKAPVGYSSNVTVNVTGSGTKFIQGSSKINILENGQVVTGAVVNNSENVTGDTAMSFQLAPGLAAKSYTIRIQTGSEQVNGTFTVYSPSISASPAAVPVGYAAAKTLTITGTNTNLESNSAVSLLNGTTPVSGSLNAGSKVVNGLTQMTIQLNTGLAAGNYTLRVTSGTEVVETPFTVYTPTISITPSQAVVDYASPISVAATGTDTNFISGTTTVTMHETNGQLISGGITNVAVTDGQQLSFQIATGRGQNDYKIRITTGDEVSETTFQVKSSSTPAKVSLLGSAKTVSAGSRTGAIRVQLQNANGTQINADAPTDVLLASNSISGKFYDAASGGSLITKVTIPGGSSYADFYYEDTKAGTATVTVSSAGLAGGTQTVTVNAAAPDHLALNLSSSTATVDNRISGIVTLQDQYNNAAVSSGVYVDLATSSSTGSFYNASVNGALISQVYIAGGQSTGSFYYNETTPGGPYTLTVAYGGLGSAGENVTISPGALASFDVVPDKTSVQPDETVNFTVTALDKQGNVATGYRGTINWSTTDVSAVQFLPEDYTFQASDNGVKSFIGRFLTAGNQTVTVSDAAYNKSKTSVPVDVALSVTSLLPNSGANNVAPNAQVSITFNGPIAAVSTSVYAAVYENGSALSGVTTSIAGRVLHIGGVSLKEGSWDYTVIIPGGEIETVAGVTYSDPISWSFTTVADGTAPDPVSDPEVVAGDGSLTVSWINPTNPDFDGVEVAYRLSGATNYTVVDTVNTGVNSYTFDGLDNGSTYEIRLVAIDKTGNRSGEQTQNGIPLDMSTPDISYKAPLAGANQVTTEAWIYLTFSKVMNNSTITNSNIQLLKAGTPVPVEFNYNSTTGQVIIQPTNPLEYNTVYTVSVSSAVYDNIDQSLPENSRSWTFTTELDTTAPDEVTNLKVTAGNGSLDVSWTPPTDTDFNGVKVYWKTATGNYGNPVSVAKATNSYTISGLTNGTLYTVKVAAIDTIPNESDGVTATGTPTAGGGSGSGSTGGTVTQQPVDDKGTMADLPAASNVKTNPDGSKTAEAKISEGDFNKVFDANKGAKEFVVEIKQSADSKAAILPAGAFTKLADRAASLVLKNKSANLVIPGGAVNIANLAKELGVDAGKVEIKINVQEVGNGDADKAKEAKAEGMKPVSKVLEFTMQASAGDKTVQVSSFGGKVVKGEIPYSGQEIAGVKDKAKLSVFKFNESTGKWVYVRSKVAEGKVVFYTTTFSKYTIMEYSKTFGDIAKHWSKSEVELMASKFVVNGISSDKFAPEANVTRAEFAAMLVRALGLPAENAAPGFDDVKSSDWFAVDVATANKAGLVQGFGDKTFKPNAQITRDQMAAMVVRALKAAGKDIAVSKLDQDSLLSKFVDKGQVQGWAKADVAAAVKAGIVNGATPNSFAPIAKATRAESAVMLKRMMLNGELL